MKKKLDSTLSIFVNCSFAMLSILFVAILYAFFINPLFHILHSHSWEEAPCVILKSDAILAYSNIYAPQKNTYNPQINYQYSFNGKSYIGEKYNFDDMASDQSRIEGIVSEFPVGLEAKCYVNQNNPSEAVLYRGTYPQLWICLTPLFFLIMIISFYIKFRVEQKQLLSMADPQKFNRREYKKKKNENKKINHFHQ